jgi:Kef-type K+ transport system membrane component KefB
VKAGGLATSAMTIVLALAFIAAMSFLVKPSLNHLIKLHPQYAAAPGPGIVVAMLILVFSAALFTEIIGIHALFGAFLAGVAMPANEEFRSHLRGKLENFSSSLLLPLFFAFTGLRTQLGLLHDGEGWILCAGIILTATLGKLGGSMITARCTGLGWHDSFILGALMNTRGLVELIVLNLGLDLGILSPSVFTMLVIMALVTTAMTGPLLTLGKLE